MKKRSDETETWDQRLRAVLADRGWSVVELARRMGHEDQPFRDRLYKYVRGAVKNPRGEMFEEIAQAIGKGPRWLRYGERRARDRDMPPQDVATLGKRVADKRRGVQGLVFDNRSASDPLDDDAAEDAVPAAVFEGGRFNVPKGEIPQVSARIGMGLSTDDTVINIPIGDESIAATPVVDTWKVPESVLRRRFVGLDIRALHIIESEGDSMEPTIHNGDFVFVDTSRRVPSPPGIFALFDGFGQTLKRLEIVPNTDPPKVLLIPDNPHHQKYERNLDEVSIIGRYLCRLTMD